MYYFKWLKKDIDPEVHKEYVLKTNKEVIAIHYLGEGYEYGIHKVGCKDIAKTIQRKNQCQYGFWLNSGNTFKDGTPANAHFNNLQDAIESIGKQAINENDLEDNPELELIYATTDYIEIFNCAK